MHPLFFYSVPATRIATSHCTRLSLDINNTALVIKKRMQAGTTHGNDNIAVQKNKVQTPALKFLWLHNIHAKRTQVVASCHLYVFDNQLWEKLASYLDHKSTNKLIRTGDKRLIKGLVPTIKFLRVSPIQNEGHILSLVLGSNLQQLTIEDFPGPSPSTDVCKSLMQEALPKSRLQSLTVTRLRLVGKKTVLCLPKTLTSLQIMHLDWSFAHEPYDCVVLNGAKLKQISLHHAGDYSAPASWQLQHIANELVAKSFETLESLWWTFSESCPLNLARHTSMETLTVCAYHLYPQFVPPPNILCLVMMGPIATTPILKSVAVNFPKSLVHLNMLGVWGGSSTLDISLLPNIERLTCYNERHGIICAPTTNLVIVCKNQPTFLINKGSGSVSIQCDCLYLSEGNLPPSNVCDAIDWLGLQSLELCSSSVVPSSNHIDYSILRKACNIQNVYIYGDMLATFAHRNGHQFLNMFPKIASLDWTLEIDLCHALKSSAFSVPPSVNHIRLGILKGGRMSFDETMAYFPWVNSLRGENNGNGSIFVPKHTVVDSYTTIHFDRCVE